MQAAAQLSGLQWPRDILEVPSMLFERMCMDPRSLKHLLRHYEDGTAVSEQDAAALAAALCAAHYGPLGFHARVVTALVDQLAAACGPGGDAGQWWRAVEAECGAGSLAGAGSFAGDDSTARDGIVVGDGAAGAGSATSHGSVAGDDGAAGNGGTAGGGSAAGATVCIDSGAIANGAERAAAVVVGYPGGLPVTARQLSLLPVAAHQRGGYYGYLYSWCVSAAVWDAAIEPTLQDAALHPAAVAAITPSVSNCASTAAQSAMAQPAAEQAAAQRRARLRRLFECGCSAGGFEALLEGLVGEGWLERYSDGGVAPRIDTAHLARWLHASAEHAAVCCNVN